MTDNTEVKEHAESGELTDSAAYYMQDSRSYTGNDVMWWKKNGSGYTSDLREAHIYNKADAEVQRRCRDTDIPWLKSYIDTKSRPAVDFQYISQKEMAAREAFEKWYLSDMDSSASFDRDAIKPEYYDDIDTQEAWWGWQAGRASGIESSRDAVKEEIIAAIERKRVSILENKSDPSWTEHFADLQNEIRTLLGAKP